MFASQPISKRTSRTPSTFAKASADKTSKDRPTKALPIPNDQFPITNY
jgi:hypothetical protein